MNQFLVHSFNLGLLKHLRADINTLDVLEASVFFEVLTNKSCSASKIENLSSVFWNDLRCGNTGHEILNFLRIWVSSSLVNTLVVESDIVVVLFNVSFVIFVVLFKFFDLFGSDLGKVKLHLHL